MPRAHKINIINKCKRNLLGNDNEGMQIATKGQHVRVHDNNGNYRSYEISIVRGLSNSNKPYVAELKKTTAPLDGVRNKRSYIALSAQDVDDGLVMKSGFTKYEGSMVHRALHHRKVPKRKSSKREHKSTSRPPSGMAAGILRVRKGGDEILCDVVTLAGAKQSKTIKQLKAMYDIKGPIKGRVRKKSLRKSRTLRILGDENDNSGVLGDGEPPSDSNGEQKELGGQHGKGGKTLRDDIRELERELEEARKIAARGRGNLPGGNPPEGAYSKRRTGGEESDGGNAGGARVGSSSRFPRRGYPK